MTSLGLEATTNLPTSTTFGQIFIGTQLRILRPVLFPISQRWCVKQGWLCRTKCSAHVFPSQRSAYAVNSLAISMILPVHDISRSYVQCSDKRSYLRAVLTTTLYPHHSCKVWLRLLLKLSGREWWRTRSILWGFPMRYSSLQRGWVGWKSPLSAKRASYLYWYVILESEAHRDSFWSS